MHAFKELREIEESLCLLELASDDPEGIEGQLKHCNVSLVQQLRLPP